MAHPLILSLTAALLLAASPSVSAQAVVQALPGTTDADRLGDVMRQLAANPQNVDALLHAGELSIVVGDLSGAAALFARAEKIDSRNGRVKAGMASILVRSERPGEALRYFAQAEALGLDPRRFAADRALAYDLIGQQDRAQRDYRVALRDAPDDETVRRYALSLGIAGKQAAALEQLAPLLQKTDRGAWRARAFVLAMTGDVPAAERIATTMMPAGMAQGLLPFFARLPALPASDRAFAVHFGEVHATPERIADARMAPPLPMLGPDPTAPVMVATVQPAATAAGRAATRGRKAKPGRVEIAAAAPITAARAAIVQPQRTPAVGALPVAAAQAPVVPPAARPSVSSPVVVASRAAPPAAVPAEPLPAGAGAQAAPVSSTTATPVPITSAPGIAVQAVPAASSPMVVVAAPSAAPVAPRPVPGLASGAVTAGVVPASVPASTATYIATPAVAVPAPVPSSSLGRTGDDSILARIVAGLSIPASELDVAPVVAPPAQAAMSEGGARVVAEAQAKTRRDAAAKAVLARTLAVETPATDRRKVLADKKALARHAAAADKKAAADREAAEEKRIARANPARIWVQVAGGATEGDLPKAWKAVKAKAPAVFGSRTGWTTPLRATNRVLAGPFRTDAEARSFVNQLAKGGVSAFSFTSDAGQPVTRLLAK